MSMSSDITYSLEANPDATFSKCDVDIPLDWTLQ